LNKSSSLTPALSVTKFIIVTNVILVTLSCSTNPPQDRTRNGFHLSGTGLKLPFVICILSNFHLERRKSNWSRTIHKKKGEKKNLASHKLNRAERLKISISSMPGACNTTVLAFAQGRNFKKQVKNFATYSTIHFVTFVTIKNN
jgi:hypothetical protein